MRILFVSNRGLLPIVDGHTRRSYNILRLLCEQHEVTFVSLYESDDEVSTQNLRQLNTLCKAVEFYKAPSKKFSIAFSIRLLASVFSKTPYTLWRHYTRKFHRRISQLASSGEFDAVHLDNLPIAYCLQNNTSVPQILTDHDVSHIKCSRMAEQKKNILAKLFLHMEALKLRAFERHMLDLVDICICVSESDKANLLRLNPRGNLRVIENGVDIDEFNVSASDPCPTVLLWFGGFSHGPNMESMKFYLENIHQLVKQHIPGVTLEILGGGDTALLKKLSSNDNSIHIRGYVEDISPYASKAGIFIAPITSGGGTKLKVIEAMAFGKAIVTTSIGCEGIDGKNGEDYLVADTPLDFAKAIVELSQNNKLRLEIGNNARKFIESKYDWNIIKNNLYKIYPLLSSIS